MKVRPLKKRTIDVRGLTPDERKVGATVALAWDLIYRVTEIKHGTAKLEFIERRTEK